MKDVELLEKHRSGNPTAFAELVEKHIGWVYGVARRQLRDEHLAQDVAQAVFVLLHRKSPRFPGDGAMIRWMHRTAGYASRVGLRNERRRKMRETEAAMLRPLSTAALESDPWLELAPMLDELIGKLNRSDREAVLLRFFRDLSFAEVGVEMGATPEAARKRVERAIGKLKGLAAKRGLTFSGAALTVEMAQHARIAVPAGLIQSAASGAAPSSAFIVKGTILMMAIKKAAIAAAVLSFVMAVTGMIWVVVPETPKSAPEETASQPPPSTQASPTGRTFVALAPAMRWNGDIPQLQLDKRWYELEKLNDLPIAQFTDIAKKIDARLWRRMFQEDLDQIFATMKLPLGPFKLELRTLDTGETVTINNAAATEENRQLLIWGNEQDTSKSTTSLFSAIRWQDGKAQVQVDGNDTWYGLEAIDGQQASTIFDFARRTYPDHWQKEIEENAVPVLQEMDHRFPAGVAMLQVRTLDTDKVVSISKRTHNVGRLVRPAEGPSLAGQPAARIEGQGYARLSPFSAVRWREADYQIQLDGSWYGLVAIDDQPLAQIVEFARKQYGDSMVQKRIDEDLVEVLTTMGHEPGATVKLQVRNLETGEVTTRENVPMTSENRGKILTERHANPGPAPAPPAGTSGL